MTPNSVDVHDGATPDELADLYVGVVTALATDCRRLALRPGSVTISTSLGVLSATVYLPSDDVPGVDALAGAYGLDPHDGSPELYERRGPVVLAGHAATVTVYTTRPDEPQAVRALAVADPPTRPAAPVVAAPVKVPAERAKARTLAVVGAR